MNLQIETITTPQGKMDVIRDVEKVRKLIEDNERLKDELAQLHASKDAVAIHRTEHEPA